MAYLSEKIVLAAFRNLSNLTDQEGKKATEVVSALRYLLATSKILKHNNSTSLNLSVSSSSNREEFIASVGEIVSLSDGGYYTNNFFDEFLTNPDFAVRNNFLTTRLKTDANYPGRPAPVLNLNNGNVKILSNIKKILEDKYHNFKQIKTALCIWLMRNISLKQNIITIDELLSNINSFLLKEYEKEVATALTITVNELNNFLSDYNIGINEILDEKIAKTILLINKQSTQNIRVAMRNFINHKAINKIYFGCPGTGKSYQMKQDTEGYKKFGTTFHPEYDYAAFVGSYKPKMHDEKIMYAFTPQIFTKAYVYAYQNPNENVALVIEEINRGNCAMIFGDIFQLLDRKLTGESEYDDVTPDSDLASYLESELGDKFKGKLVLPGNLSILATMNTSDQSLFPMDSAFKRRWEWQYIPINLEKADEMAFMVNEKSYNWKKFLEIVNDKIYKLTESEDKQVGTFFVSDSKIIQEQQFKSKVMFYLWFDIFKNEIESEHNIFKDKDGKPVTFSDLFKERADVNLLEEILTRLELIPIEPFEAS